MSDEKATKETQQLDQLRELNLAGKGDPGWQWPIAFVDVKRLFPDAVLPQYKTPGSAGADLCAYITREPGDGDGIRIDPGETMKVPTGIAIRLPSGCHGMVKGRSGLAARGIDAHIGTLDCDYTGEVHVLLHNHSRLEIWRICHGERIGQLVIVPTMRGLFGEVDELPQTQRGSGGFGSTGR